MSTVYLYSQTSQLLQRWEKLLTSHYLVKSVQTFQELQSLVGEDTFVVLHDDDKVTDVIEKLDLLHEAYEKKNTLVLRSKPSVAEGECFLSHDIGGYGNAHMSDAIFLQALEVISSGNIWLYPELMEDLVTKVNALNQNSHPAQLLDALTSREKEVADLVAKGESNKRIASQLAISENTVKLHIASIFEKLHVDNRVTLALRVNNLG